MHIDSNDITHSQQYTCITLHSNNITHSLQNTHYIKQLLHGILITIHKHTLITLHIQNHTHLLKYTLHYTLIITY